MPSSSNSSVAAMWPGIAAVMGLLLLAVGLAWPLFADTSPPVTQQQTTEYLQSHAALEKAAAEQGRRTQPSGGEADALRTARLRFEKAKQEVADAKASPTRLATLLKIGGGLLVVAGAAGLLMQRGGA